MSVPWTKSTIVSTFEAPSAVVNWNVSAPPSPVRRSLAPFPSITFAPSLPVMVLAIEEPVRSMALVALSVTASSRSTSALGESAKVTEVATRSLVPSPANSFTMSPVAST